MIDSHDPLFLYLHIIVMRMFTRENINFLELSLSRKLVCLMYRELG